MSRWTSVGRTRSARKGLRESTLPFVATVRTLVGAGFAAGARVAGIGRRAARARVAVGSPRIHRRGPGRPPCDRNVRPFPATWLKQTIDRPPYQGGGRRRREGAPPQPLIAGTGLRRSAGE